MNRITSFLIIFFSLNSYADFYDNRGMGLPANSFAIDSYNDFFLTTSKFLSETGELVSLNSGEQFFSFNSNLSLTYSLTKKLDVAIGGRFRMQNSTTLLNNISASGPERFFMMSHYFITLSPSLRLGLEAYFAKTMYQTTDYVIATLPNDELILGDAGAEMWFGGLLNYQFNKSFSITAFGKFVIPPNNLSKEIGYRADLKYNSGGGNGFELVAGLEGIFSLNSDQFTGDITAKPLQANGVTNLYNSVNRSRFIPYGGLNYKFKKIMLSFRGGQVIQGVSTDAGSFFSLGLTYFTKSKFQKFNPETVFKEYEIEAKIIQVSPREHFVKIDKGLSEDIEKGMKIDIYQSDHLGNNKYIAKGYVYKASADKAIVKIIRKYKDIALKVDFVARGYYLNN